MAQPRKINNCLPITWKVQIHPILVVLSEAVGPHLLHLFIGHLRQFIMEHIYCILEHDVAALAVLDLNVNELGRPALAVRLKIVDNVLSMEEIKVSQTPLAEHAKLLVELDQCHADGHRPDARVI